MGMVKFFRSVWLGKLRNFFDWHFEGFKIAFDELTWEWNEKIKNFVCKFRIKEFFFWTHLNYQKLFTLKKSLDNSSEIKSQFNPKLYFVISEYIWITSKNLTKYWKQTKKVHFWRCNSNIDVLYSKNIEIQKFLVKILVFSYTKKVYFLYIHQFLVSKI